MAMQKDLLHEYVKSPEDINIPMLDSTLKRLGNMFPIDIQSIMCLKNNINEEKKQFEEIFFDAKSKKKED